MKDETFVLLSCQMEIIFSCDIKMKWNILNVKSTIMFLVSSLTLNHFKHLSSQINFSLNIPLLIVKRNEERS